MKIEFDFTNGLLPFSQTIEQINPIPVELRVENTGNSNQQVESLHFYIHTLLNLFRGVSNITSSKIGRASIEKSWFGKIESSLHKVTWEPRIEKYFFVIYDLMKAKLVEDMYVADAIYSSGKSKKVNEPAWLTPLLNPKSKASATELEHLRDVISTITENIEGYNLTFRNGKLLLQSAVTGDSLDIDEVGDDDIYVLLRVVYQILGKGLHQGVFFIDARWYSDAVIKALTDISRFVYGYSFIFLYNVSPDSKVERDVVTLPNFTYKK